MTVVQFSAGDLAAYFHTKTRSRVLINQSVIAVPPVTEEAIVEAQKKPAAMTVKIYIVFYST